MPFIPHTPESLLPRSDSKNPSTTCKGITSSGRPCRRSLAASNGNSPTASPGTKYGVIAILPDTSDDHEAAAAFFCWQHKEQAGPLANGEAKDKGGRVLGLKERSSIDTLVDRLGVLNVEDNDKTSKQGNSKHRRKPVKKETLPPQWQDISGPLMSVPENRLPPSSQYRRKPRGDLSFVLSIFCCVRSTDPEYTQAPRIRHYDESPRQPSVAENTRLSHHSMSTPPMGLQSAVSPRAAASKKADSSNDINHRQPLSTLNPTIHSHRPALARDLSTQTQSLLALIPKSLSPQTTSLLLAELAKPTSPFDQDGGWIYIFWLTPDTSAAPEPDLASSLLLPSTKSNPRVRRTSELKQDYPASTSIPSQNSSGKATILLKIGRASNVQRRMNEWTRQCNHNLTLVRYYPYFPSSPSLAPASPFTPSTSSPNPRKVPYAHRVERLIHIELAEKRVKRDCVGCGKEHREWFEVEASRKGVRNVDQVVRRWVDWAETKTT
ncbi:MAG: hypothetical protein Q9187_005450 [Circinaria calcarea]